MQQSDHELVSAYLSGDSQAFAEIYERYIEKLYTFIFYKVHNRETAEDIVSQVFMKAYERLSQYSEERGTVSAWLHTIARNSVIDHFRTQKTSTSIEDAWDLSSDDDPVSDADTALKLQEIRSVMQELSSDQRDVLMLRLWSGYTFAEVADALGKTEASCKMAYKRGLERVRKDLLLSFLLLFFLS